MYLLLPLLAALAFAFGSMVFKRAFQEGATIGHAAVLNNVILAVVFLPLMAWDPKPVPWHLWHQPVITSMAFVLGHLLNVIALKKGDVSVATPLLGSKVIFVALVSWLAFGVPVQAGQWAAAALSSLGVLVMGFTDFRPGGQMGLTTLLSLGCALCFAFTDLFIQIWGSGFGVFHFLPLQFVSLAFFSLLILPFVGWKSLRAPRSAWKWIIASTGLSAVQAILITGTIAAWKDASGVNVVYATRGLWSVLLVWAIGGWMGNTERERAGLKRMTWRLIGALLILVAVALSVWHAGNLSRL
jgi:drug/metabolite transporter (DMT)-like permease